MRGTLLSILAVCVFAGFLTPVVGQTTDATKVLAATREALGGEQRQASVKTFVATGRTRQVSGNTLVPIEFEIACELPDKFVRHDEIPAKESGVTSAGFNGEGLIQVPPPAEPQAPTRPASQASSTTPPAGTGGATAATAKPAPAPGTSAAAPVGASSTTPPPDAAFKGLAAPPGRAGGPPVPPPDPRKARVTSLKQDFARLTLGMFANSFSGYPLTFTLDGQAEAPQGKADIVEVKGAGNFALKFFINTETHLPIMVSWTMPPTTVVMTEPGDKPPENVPTGAVVVQAPARPAASASKEEQEKYVKDVQELRKKAMTRTVEYRIYYADYRDVGKGLKFPFRLRKAVGGETVEETNFDEYKINVRIDQRRFEAIK